MFYCLINIFSVFIKLQILYIKIYLYYVSINIMFYTENTLNDVIMSELIVTKVKNCNITIKRVDITNLMICNSPDVQTIEIDKTNKIDKLHIKNMKNLKTVLFHGTNCSEVFFDSNLESLEVIECSNVSDTLHINADNLRSLDLMHCNLTTNLSLFKKLEYVRIEKCIFEDIQLKNSIKIFECMDSIIKNDLIVENNDSVNEIVFDNVHCNVFNFINLKNLTKLVLINNKTHYDKSPHVNISKLFNLNKLAIENSDLTEIDFTHYDKLTKLHIPNNKLRKLNINNLVNLTHLDCSNNVLEELNINSLINLTRLNCSNNMLSKLEFNEQSQIEKIICNNNKINELIIDKLDKLISLYCSYNKNINVLYPVNLVELYISGCELKNICIDMCKNLKELNCSFNEIEQINLNKNIEMVDVSFNHLSELNLLKCNNIKYINCKFNQINKLSVDNNIIDPHKGTIALQCNHLQEYYLPLTGRFGHSSIRTPDQYYTCQIINTFNGYENVPWNFYNNDKYSKMNNIYDEQIKISDSVIYKKQQLINNYNLDVEIDKYTYLELCDKIIN